MLNERNVFQLYVLKISVYANNMNSNIGLQLIEGHQISSLHWYPQAQQEAVCYDRQHAPQHQTDEAFFHPLDCGPTLQMG